MLMADVYRYYFCPRYCSPSARFTGNASGSYHCSRLPLTSGAEGLGGGGGRKNGRGRFDTSSLYRGENNVHDGDGSYVSRGMSHTH